MLSFIRGFFKFILNGFLFIFLLIFVGIVVAKMKAKMLIKDNTFLVLKLDNGFFKENETQQIFAPRHSFRTIRNVFNQSKQDPRIKGIIIETQATNPGYAHATELHRLIEEYKAAGKNIYVYAGSFGQGQNATAMYYGISSASEIWMQRLGAVNLLGIGIETFFAKNFLDRHKLKMHVEKRKDFKGAMDGFLMNDYAPTVKENLTRVFTDILDIAVSDIAKARNVKIEDLIKTVNSAPLSDEEGVQYKLIDKIGSKYELYTHIKNTFNDPKLVPLEKYPLKQFAPKQPHIAVIYASGMFTCGYENGLCGMKETVTHTIFNKAVERAIKDGAKAIVVRINSPGGYEEASEAMRSALEYAESKGIKIYASFGDYAASGGYYVATAASKIFTEKTTLTGSIGVYVPKLTTEEAWNEYGITWKNICVGKNADIYLSSKDFTPEQQQLYSKLIDKSYARFIDICRQYCKKQGREFKDEYAEGKVYSGKAAIELGLAEEGSLFDAIKAAAKDVDLPQDAIIEYPYGGLMELILNAREDSLSMIMKSLLSFGTNCVSSYENKMVDPTLNNGRIL